MWMEKRGPRYWAAWREGGTVRRLALYSDKKASPVRLAELIRRQARGETDLLDPYQDHRHRPLTEHIQDWIDYLTDTGKSDSYIRLCQGRMTRLVEDCGWQRLGDIDADSFEVWRETA